MHLYMLRTQLPSGCRVGCVGVAMLREGADHDVSLYRHSPLIMARL